LMLANWPPLGLFQVQTFGGIYAIGSAIFNLHKSSTMRRHAGGG
jgi:hypothetical protein